MLISVGPFSLNRLMILRISCSCYTGMPDIIDTYCCSITYCVWRIFYKYSNVFFDGDFQLPRNAGCNDHTAFVCSF